MREERENKSEREKKRRIESEREKTRKQERNPSKKRKCYIIWLVRSMKLLEYATTLIPSIGK